MTNIANILERKREEVIFRPLSFSIYNLQVYISSFFLAIFLYWLANYIFLLDSKNPSLFFSLSLVVAIIIIITVMYACLCWPEKSHIDPSFSLFLFLFPIFRVSKRALESSGR
jgi:hypothetical protein